MTPAGTMMNKAVPWSIKGVGFDAREAAREAARRSGMSLGEWLNTVIAEQAAETGVDASEIDADMRLEAIAAKLARMSNKVEDAEAPRRTTRTLARQADLDDDAMRPPSPGRNGSREEFQRERPLRASSPANDYGEAARRPSAAYRETEAATPVESARMQRKSRRLDSGSYQQEDLDDDYRNRNHYDPETLLNDAIVQFDRRAQEAQKKTASALANVAQWIETSENRRENEQHVLAKVTRKLDEIQHHVSNRDEDGDRFAADALDKVARRLENIESRVMQRANEDGGPVRQSLERLESRIEALARRPAPVQPALETSLRDIDGKIAALNQRIDSSAAAAKAQARIDAMAIAAEEAPRPRSSERLGAAPAKSSFGEAIADIMRRQQALEKAVAPPVGQNGGQADFGQRMEAIAARLERGARPAAAQAALLQRDHGPGEPPESTHLQAPVLANPSHTQMARLRQEMAELSSSLGNIPPRGSVDALETAMRDLGQRIDAIRSANGSENLLAPMQGIAGDLRKALSEIDPRGNAEKLQQQMQSLHVKLDEMGARPQDGQALAALQQQMREIRELIGQNAAQPLPFELIERQIAALSERIDKSIRSAQPMGVVRGQQPDLSGLADNIRDVIDRALPRPALQQLGDRLESLDAKIDEAISRSGPDAQMAELSHRMAEVHRALGESHAPPAVDMRPLEEMMREISGKLDAPRPAQFAPNALKTLETQVSDLAARLDVAQPALSQEAIAQFEHLARGIDALQARVASQAALAGPDNAGLEETLRELSRTLENARKPEPPVQLLQAVEAQLGRVAEKLEHSNQGLWALSSNAGTHFDTLSKRIDSVQALVARQMDELQASQAPGPQNPDLSGLEDMVRSLSSKIEAVRGDQHSAKAIENLEAQITRMAERLESSATGAAALGSLERTVNDLFAQIEDTRHAALDAAETAARTAARDTLREAMQAGTVAAPSPELVREIAGIKSQHEETERRTHSTLAKVHDTLERVVDRLTSLEEDGSSRAVEAAKPAALPSRPASARAAADTGTAKLAGKPGPVVTEPAKQADVRLVALDEDDFLIEPGLGRASVKSTIPPKADAGLADQAEGTESAEGKGNLQNIIAAARRLHQAQAEKTVSELAAPRARVSSRNQASQGPFGSLKLLNNAGSFLAARKRPLLLMVASLMLVFATVEAIRVFGLGNPVPGKAGQVTSDAKPPVLPPADAMPAPVQKAGEPMVDPRKGAALTGEPGNSQVVQKAVPPVDSNPVSSIPAPLASPGSTIAKPDTASAGTADSALLRLAASGDAAAQYEMGLRLGEGRNTTRDMVAAAAWLEKAAAQNLAPAQYRTASMYEKGVGVTKDLAQAKAWYLKAASNGNTRAMHNLAVLTADSGDGKPDYAGAVAWFTKAAEYGVRDSQFNLAVLYARGLGVPQNMVKSWVWFALAAGQGDNDAATKKKEVGGRLDNKQLEQAQAELAAFQPKSSDVAANDVAAPAEGWDAYAAKAAPKADASKFIGARPDAKGGARAKNFGL